MDFLIDIPAAKTLEPILGVPGADVVQIGIVFAAFILSTFVGPICSLIPPFIKHERANEIIKNATTPTIWLFFLMLGNASLTVVEYPVIFLEISSICAAAWIMKRIIDSINISAEQRRLLSWFILAVTGLLLINQIETIAKFLSAAEFNVGELKISLWSITKAGVLFFGLVWLVTLSTEILKKQLNRTKMTRAARTLIQKFVGTLGFVIAFLVALEAMGIDLSALTWFGGAIGIGVGFGLRTVIANYMSGIMLLMDRSLKPGDVITVNDTYGEILQMHSRYVVVRPRNGMEVLIPNESLITNEVINWSFNNPQVRHELSIGVSYESDMEQVRQLLLEAAYKHKRVLEVPKPICFIDDFGDSSVVFLLRYWQNDSQNGVNNLKGELRMDIWNRLKEAGINIPFPQRVVHMAEPANDANPHMEPEAPAKKKAVKKPRKRTASSKKAKV